MARALRYADAVALLGGDSPAVAALDRALGGALMVATGGGAALVASMLDARGEAVRAGHELVGNLRDRVRGYSRFDRTQRLMAAHTVVVITAFFEELEGTPLPLDLRSLRLAAEDQLRLAGLRDSQQSMVQALLDTPVPMPGPGSPYEATLGSLKSFYTRLAHDWVRFLSGFAVWDGLDEAHQREVRTTLTDAVPEAAVARYEIQYRQLAVDAPEFAWWAGQQEHQATRRALAGLEGLLRELSAGRVPDDRRESLGRAYRALLTRPILSEGDAPDEVVIPTLAASYIDPDYRIVTSLDGRSAASESLWDAAEVATDLATFLAGHLTSPGATDAPLLVLGQPGAGKSVLTRILAARLPTEEFVPVRVELRSVPADADVQDQIEHAIYSATGRRTGWPDLVDLAGDALPVVLLDGFDELLQATGASQTDYLVKVARFQQREAVQGRPVAVIVTSRTAVADRARTPPDTVLLRLEPFSPEQIDDWLGTWNDANRAGLAARGLAPLDPAAARRLPDLSAQPLMLLMLALYDADSNALQRQGVGDLDEAGLYEELLRTFAAREVRKGPPDRPDDEIEAAVDAELLRLSVVAFSMFNRGRQWVTETELDADLAALHGEPPRRRGLRADLGAGETVLGRFFFIQRARALRDERALTTFEFLHATFGEYLVARLVHRLVADLTAQERTAAGAAFGAGGVQDGLFHALLSFAPLSSRGPVLTFLQELAAHVPQADRLPVLLFRRLDTRADDARYATYQPATVPAWSRHGRYALNLVLLAAVYGGGVNASTLFAPADDVVGPWRSYARLWQAALTAEEWSSLIYAVRISHRWTGGNRDLTVEPDRDPERPPEPLDLYWLYDVPANPATPGGLSGWRFNDTHELAREVAFTGESLGGIAAHALEPLFPDLPELALTTLGTTTRGWDRSDTPDPRPRTIAHELLRLTVARATGEPPDDLAHTYLVLAGALSIWSDALLDNGFETVRSAICLNLRDDARHIPTADLTEIVGMLVARPLRGRDAALIIEGVIDHVAVTRPTPDDWNRLRSIAEGLATAGFEPHVRWQTGLSQAGLAPDRPRSDAEVNWEYLRRQHPRLLAQARVMYRVEFGLDLDEIIAEAERRSWQV